MLRGQQRAYLVAGILLVLVCVFGMVIARPAAPGLYRAAWSYSVPASLSEQRENHDAIAPSRATTGHGQDDGVALSLKCATVNDRRVWVHVVHLSLPPPGRGAVSGVAG